MMIGNFGDLQTILKSDTLSDFGSLFIDVNVEFVRGDLMNKIAVTIGYTKN